MAKVIFTAWKDKSQLLDVRNEFYPLPSYEGPDLRSHACATVEAWKLRGNVPHHVEATALLTDAILHDDAQQNSIFSIRATYSAAFCRFVTGLVDSKIHGQRKTMFQRAVDLGLPASFVELRHEATHREPPSLVVLRKASQRSLEWLWDNYWAGIEELGDAPAIEYDDTAAIGSAVRDTLRKFAKWSEPAPKKRKRDQGESVAIQLVSICHASSEGLKLLPALLLDESNLIDSDRKLGDSLKETFDKYDPVLLKMTENSPSFLTYLTEELVDRLAFRPENDSPRDASAEALSLWLSHLSTTSTWKTYQPFFPRSYVLCACDQNSNNWTKALSNELRKKGDVVSVAPSAQNGSSKKRALLKGSKDASPGKMEKLRAHGWGPVERWDSRPLGVAPTK